MTTVLINLILNLSLLVGNAKELPRSLVELRNTSVMVVNSRISSGGTGSILSSSNLGSDILTNKHVCQVIKNGGFIIKDRLKAKIISYKEYDRHDLCLIHVDNNLHVNLELAESRPGMAELSRVSGFPRLMPNTITIGHFSDIIPVKVMMGTRPCTNEEFLISLECMFFGYKPIVQTFQAQHTSNLIQPGNSGSAVFNSKGNLSGVVFAGSGELAFGLIVPYDYVKHFIKNLNKYTDIYPDKNTQVDEIEGFDLDEDMAAKCRSFLKPLALIPMCKELKYNLLYRKN